MTDLYTPAFYSGLAASAKASAEVVVPLVLKLLPGVNSVLDVGCGTGEWLRVFQDRGNCDVLGIEGDWLKPAKDIPFGALDIKMPFHLNQAFDLVVSLEVAEHLPIERADGFVDDLTRHAPVVLFSAAIPGQGGTGHINCRWPSWWAERFARRGYDCYDPLRPLIWTDDRVAWWYRQNIVLFANAAGAARYGLSEVDEAAYDLDRVHPELWRQTAKF